MGNAHLASAKMRSPAGLGRDNDPPHWTAKLLLVASRPGPWRGFGLLSPPAPRGLDRRTGPIAQQRRGTQPDPSEPPKAGVRAGRRFVGPPAPVLNLFGNAALELP